MAIRRVLSTTPVYIILIVIGLFFLIPLLWPILASINPQATLAVSASRMAVSGQASMA